MPAPGNHNFLTVEGARIDGHLAFSLGAFASYANNPFTLDTCVSSTGTCDGTQVNNLRIVRDLVTVDLLGAITLGRRYQIGFVLPYTSVKGDGLQSDLSSPTAGQAERGGLSGSGLGDPMLELKARLLGGPADRFVLGASAFGTLPLGKSSAKGKYLGDGSADLGARAIADVLLGRLQIGANLGAVYRDSAQIGNANLGSELLYGVGASYKITPLLFAVGEGHGSSRFTSTNGTNGFELDGALRLVPLGGRFSLTAGAGAGLVSGVGVPGYRVFGGLAYTNETADQDGDGIPDDADQCPTIPEDRDGFQDDDGCPDPDNDGDGIEDGADKCPNEPETLNGYQDQDGCPDEIPDADKDGIPDAEDKCPNEGGGTVLHRKGEFYGCPDRDGDGVPDKIDKCPDAPEDTDGYQDEDGCPDPDNDGDGINDVDDECPDQPEVFNGYKDQDGCPDEVPDRDHDGITDDLDKCPDAPETYNGIADDDGCPDGPSLVETTGDQVKIKDVINFGNDSEKIKGKKSFTVLDAVAGLLRHHPEIFKIEIAGHTDDKGDHDHNVDLSKRRAASVMSYLVDKGVDAKRLQSAGYGPDKPLGDNKKAAGRAANRRVEFNIVSSTKGMKVESAPAKPKEVKPVAPPAAKPEGAQKPPKSLDMGDL